MLPTGGLQTNPVYCYCRKLLFLNSFQMISSTDYKVETNSDGVINGITRNYFSVTSISVVTDLTLKILLSDTKYQVTLNNIIKSTTAKLSVIMYRIIPVPMERTYKSVASFWWSLFRFSSRLTLGQLNKQYHGKVMLSSFHWNKHAKDTKVRTSCLEKDHLN